MTVMVNVLGIISCQVIILYGMVLTLWCRCHSTSTPTIVYCYMTLTKNQIWKMI